MKNKLFLIVYNLMVIASSALFFVLTYRNWNTGSFSEGILLSLAVVAIAYVTAWLLLGLLYRFKFIRNEVEPRQVWFSMIPNGLIVLFLLVTGIGSHTGFVNFILAQVIFVSILFIPFIFMGMAKIRWQIESD